MSKVALVIPARMGSTRLQRKALADIEGQPMVVRVCERAARVRGVNRVIVATDAEEIAAAARRAGFQAEITPELPSGTERVAFVAKGLKEEVIVNLQGDEPVMHPESVEAALAPVLEKGCRMGSVFTPFRSIEEFQNPSNVKVLVNRAGHAITFSRAPIPFRQNAVSDEELLKNPFLGKHLGIYVYERAFLLSYGSLEVPLMERCESLEQLRALYHGVAIGMGRTQHVNQSVDTLEDLELARKMFREQGKG